MNKTNTFLKRWTLCFTSYKNSNLKVKLWWARERKKKAFLYRLFCPKKIFLTFVLSRCIVYLISLQNINTFTYQKTLLHTFFCFSKKSPKAFRAFFRKYMIQKTIGKKIGTYKLQLFSVNQMKHYSIIKYILSTHVKEMRRTAADFLKVVKV